MTFESHLRTALDVENHTVTVILGGPSHTIPSHALSPVEKLEPVELRQPGEAVLNLIGMYPASPDMVYVDRLP